MTLPTTNRRTLASNLNRSGTRKAPPTHGPGSVNDAARRAGFTLIELILVMALLAIAMGVTFPTLRTFFHGRVLDSEARRLLALSRYGQSRAVAEGMPMILWIDARASSYGLEAAAGYVDEDQKAVEFQLDNDLQLKVAAPPPNALPSAWDPATAVAHTSAGWRRGLPMIRLLPDGFIEQTSPEYVEIREGEKDAVWLVQTTNRLAYELRVERPTSNWR